MASTTNGAVVVDPGMGAFGIGNWEWDIARHAVVWSPELRAVYGIPADDTSKVTFERFLSFVHPDDRAKVMAVVSETLTSRRTYHEQRFRLVRPDGQVRDLLSRATLEFSPDGQPSRLFGVDIDLGATPVATASRFLPGPLDTVRVGDDRSHLQQVALQAISSHVAVLDQTGRIILVNRAWSEFAVGNGSNSSRSIGVGDNYLDVCRSVASADPDADKACAGIAAVLAGQLPLFEMEYPCHSPQQQRWFLMTVSPLAAGTGSGAIVAHLDITARKQGEVALQENEDRLRAIFDNAHVGIALIDTRGNWSSINEHLCRMTGYALDELLTKSVDQLIHPEDRDTHATHVQMLVAGASDAFSVQKRIVCKTGASVWVSSALGCVRKPGGEIDYFVATFQDMTDFKEHEQRQYTLLKEMSHRGKNLLGVIQAIAGRTLTPPRSLAEANTILGGRINALAKTFDTLTNDMSPRLKLADLLRRELSSFSDRVRFHGPEIILAPKASQTFALIAHELATNALKYGSLSTASGKLAVSWELTGHEPDRRFIFRWREEGGPPAKAPAKSGFGTTLTTRVAAADFYCKPLTTFGEQGFSYEFDAPLERIGGSVVDSEVRRRLQNEMIHSLYDTWSRQRGDRGSLPKLAGFDWTRFAATGALTIAKIAVDGAVSFVQVGRTLTERLGEPLAGHLDENDVNSASLTTAYRRCAQSGEPCHELMRMDFGDGEPVTFERLLVPFAAIPGRQVTHVAGIVVIEGRTKD